MVWRRKISVVIVVVLAALAVDVGQAQVPISFYDYVRSDLKWHTIETENFRVHFHSTHVDSVSWTASEVARVAQQIYGPITELYDYEPSGKTSIIIRDFEDYSNGAAYFFDNVIVLWAPALNSPLRGRHDWIKNVVTHEFTHIVQVQSTLKSSRKRPFTYLQLLDYENVRRPDVLYGYPNVIVTYPVPALSNPAWLAEGTAQYQRSNLAFDSWDTHRDMLLRSRVLAGEVLTLQEMGSFYSHSSLEREAVYNQGYAFTLYLANRFGEDILREISVALSSWRTFNVERAIKQATGVDAQAVYDDWLAGLKEHYQTVEAERSDTTQYKAITSSGFFNFHPKYSPDGNRIAYLSNGRSSEGTTHLMIAHINEDGIESAALSVDLGHGHGYTCALGHRLVPAVNGSIDWSADGKKIVYSKRMDTQEGYFFADLFEVDPESGKSDRLTHRARASDPSYEPGGNRIVFVQQNDGTTNLNMFDGSDESVRALTTFDRGTQVFEPDWARDGWIYFAKDEGHSSGVYRVDENGTIEKVVDEPVDERSPTVSADGEYLYYASDATGIFEIYRHALPDGESARITQTPGGAFMPDVVDDKLVYANYSWDGYDIVTAPVTDQNEGTLAGISRPATLGKPTAGGTDFKFVDVPAVVSEDYRSDFTSFSFYPAIRIDQYVTRERSRIAGVIDRRSGLETLARNTKVGAYVSSREILDELSFFGGLLVGPASRSAESFGDYVAPSNLLKLERDLFIQFDYKKGIGFSRKRWSPQLSLELFNIRRNVDNGLSIEEFSCTACFPPDTSYADISYNLWELNLTARSKLNRFLLAEASYRYSPYRVTTERFFSTEFQQTIAESSSRYFIGKAAKVGMRSEVIQRHRHGDVFVSGVKLSGSYELENGSVLDRFDVEDGLLVPVYEDDNVNRLSIEGYYGRRLPGSIRGAMHGLSARLRASTILGDEVDSFYNDYVGGLVGARGYPFYALGGNETIWAQLSYTIPLFPDIARQFGFVYIDKVFLRAYADAAMAWSGSFPSLSTVRKDIGGEIRLVTGSFYLLPSAIFVSGTYGIDEFDFDIDDTFVTPAGDETVTYGKSFQFHAGLLFSFDL